MFLAVILFSAVCSAAYGIFYTTRPTSNTRTMVKLLPVGLLATLSFINGGPVTLTLALLFGCLGDGFLSRDGNRCFLAGLVSFLIGHICFMILFFQLRIDASALTQEPARVIAAGILFAVSIAVTIHINRHLGAMRNPVYAYIIVSFLLGISALLLPGQWPILLAIIGTFLFISSDVILAYDLFVISPDNRLREITSRLLWFLYWGGQTLIALAFVQATP